MKLPGPDHPITISLHPGRLRVRFAGQVVAESTRALTMHEHGHPPRHYIPLADVKQDVLTRTDHASHCPYKGDASYYSIHVDGRSAENAAWFYPAPYPAVAQIAGHVCFYDQRVDAIEDAEA